MGIMSSLGLIPRLSKDFEKCETCSQAKITKMPHKSVVRNTELLELIHSDLCEFMGTWTHGRNRYNHFYWWFLKIYNCLFVEK